MGYLEFCSNCGEKNIFSIIEGQNRFHCEFCKKIHYENPKPTATLICIFKNKLLLVKRAVEPAKGLWGLPGGFMELNETLNEAAARELKEETNLQGTVKQVLSTCSHYGTIFGDILLIGVEMEVLDFSSMQAGDDAEEVAFFSMDNLPDIAFYCHNKFIDLYKSNL